MSETDFLKLKKHDNVETNTEKFDIENYLNGNWDKIDENVGEVNTNISNINSKSTELEKELKEAQEDFYQNSIRGQASGEYIHVEDSSNCRAKIGISGNSEQETRSGKNLLELMEGTYTHNGITAVVKNGIITLNGTATAISFIGINLLKNLDLATGNTYRLSAFNTNTVGEAAENYCSLRIKQDGTKETVLSKVNSNNAIVGGFSFSYITIRTAQGITYNNFVVKPQLELGAGTSTWEQGGVSPSSDYTSKVQTVGGNVNLFDKDKFNNFTNNLQYIELTLKSNTKYTMCSNIPKGTGGCNLFAYKKGETASSSSNFVANGENRTVTTGDDGIIIIAYRNYNASLSDDPKNDYKYKLVEGTEVGEYSKYGQGCVKVTKCNKNFLKNTAVSGELNGVNRTVKEDGSVIINGTSTKWANLTVGTIQGDGNSYILSGSPSNSEIFLTVNNTEEGDIAQSKNGSDAAFIPLKGSTYSVIVCIPSKKTFNNEVVKPLIRTVNDEDNTYIKHQEQSYIMPVQQEMLEGDYFDYDNEEEVHIFGKKVLTGNENWEAIGTNASGKYRFQTKVDDIVFNADGDTYLEGICDSYKVGTPNTTYLCQESIATVQYYLIIYNEKVNDTVENFKKGLSNKNVTIYYKLATPTRLKFTDEQKAVAKELNNARTYKNVTNIYSTDEISPILSLDYAKDLEELTEYSTEERVIGRWIDGKPLYSKVGSIKFTSVYDSSGLHTRGSLIDSDIDYGTVSKVLNKNLLSSSLFNTYGTSTSNVYVENRQGNSNKGYILGFTDRTDLLNTTIYVVVEYTKTTD